MESKILRHDGKERLSCFLDENRLADLDSFARKNIQPLGEAGMQVEKAWDKYRVPSLWDKYRVQRPWDKLFEDDDPKYDNLADCLKNLSILGYQTYDR